MKTWDDWIDEDLSHAILIAIHGDIINHFCLSDCETYVYDCGVTGENFHRVDLIDINNPADMWPIIIGNRIDIYFDDFGYAEACKSWNYGQGLEFKDKNPLRAAAIVFLMMNGVNPE